MTLEKIETQIMLVYDGDGGSTVEILRTIPAEGVAAILRWLPTQTKPDPDDERAPWINRYADHADSDEKTILRNLFNEIILGRIVEFASAVPSQAVIDGQARLRQAAMDLEEVKRREAGLID